MRKIYQAVRGVICGVLKNLDYLAVFILGAAAYKFAPLQLEEIKLAIVTFDYVGFFTAVKSLLLVVWDYAVLLYDYVLSFFIDTPVEVAPVVEVPVEVPAEIVQ